MRHYSLTHNAPSVRIVLRCLESVSDVTTLEIAEKTGLGANYLLCQVIPAMLKMGLIHHSGYKRGKDGHPPRTFSIGKSDIVPKRPVPLNSYPRHRARIAKEYRTKTVNVKSALYKLRKPHDPVLAALIGYNG